MAEVWDDGIVEAVVVGNDEAVDDDAPSGVESGEARCVQLAVESGLAMMGYRQSGEEV